jgi:hypothetical protein
MAAPAIAVPFAAVDHRHVAQLHTRQWSWSAPRPRRGIISTSMTLSASGFFWMAFPICSTAAARALPSSRIVAALTFRFGLGDVAGRTGLGDLGRFQAGLLGFRRRAVALGLLDRGFAGELGFANAQIVVRFGDGLVRPQAGLLRFLPSHGFRGLGFGVAFGLGLTGGLHPPPLP